MNVRKILDLIGSLPVNQEITIVVKCNETEIIAGKLINTYVSQVNSFVLVFKGIDPSQGKFKY